MKEPLVFDLQEPFKWIIGLTIIQAFEKKKVNKKDTPRSKADIRQLNDTDPQKYRIRTGEYRVICYIDGKFVKLIEVFIRGRGKRE